VPVLCKQCSGQADLIGQDCGEADAAVIVDGDVEILMANAAYFASPVVVDSVSELHDPRLAPDTEVDELPTRRANLAAKA
jgi:hypothetical protein